jgi:hypothetical protein
MDKPGFIAPNLRADLKALTDGLRARTRMLIEASKIIQGEIDRVMAHVRQRADHLAQRRSRDNLVYAFGSIAEREGYLDLDDYAIAGLEHHGLLYAYWIALAASETFSGNRGDLLRHIFTCPIRYNWCVREGARLARSFAIALEREETELFRRRQENGSKDWRKRPMTHRQYHRIAVICRAGGFEDPGPMKSGRASDWIEDRGNRIGLWDAPEAPPEWLLDGSNDGWGKPSST